jgi:predicted nucleic acid-binding protein
MLAVADTSPLHYLILIQQETLLPVLYDRVVIPPAMYRELLRSETPEVVRQWLTHPSGWLTVQPPQHPLAAAAFPRLGTGEREAIPLAQELPDAILLIDDHDGREEAARRAIDMIGTIGVLEEATIRGLIAFPPVLAQLQATTFHGSPRLFADALARDAARKPSPPTDGH